MSEDSPSEPQNRPLQTFVSSNGVTTHYDGCDVCRGRYVHPTLLAHDHLRNLVAFRINGGHIKFWNPNAEWAQMWLGAADRVIDALREEGVL